MILPPLVFPGEIDSKMALLDLLRQRVNYSAGSFVRFSSALNKNISRLGIEPKREREVGKKSLIISLTDLYQPFKISTLGQRRL